MIQEKISLDLHKAIVEKDTVRKDLLRVILAEMCRYTKNATDEEAIKVLKKGIENASLCNTLHEIPILESYLPVQNITDDEIIGMLVPVYAGRGIDKKNIGELMKVAKEVLGKDFDGKRVSVILKRL